MNEYQLSDLNLASTIYLEGYKLLRTHREEDGRYLFVFEDNGMIQDHVLKYYNGELQYKPQDLYDKQKQLKILIRQGELNE